jgi:hypothetical protein
MVVLRTGGGGLGDHDAGGRATGVADAGGVASHRRDNCRPRAAKAATDTPLQRRRAPADAGPPHPGA